MILHVVLYMSCIYTNKKGWRTRIPDQTPILSCSGIAIPLVKLQVRPFHKWYRYVYNYIYHCTSIMALITNSGTPSFLVGTQDIGPHEVS